MIFIDISIEVIYITIFKNFEEKFYKSGKKCINIFPTKKITWRKKSGSFKLDTTVKINELIVKNNKCLKIDENTNIEDVKHYILQRIC